MNDAQMDRRSFLVGGLTLVAAGSGRLLAGEEDSRLTAAKRWFTEAQFGMMAHWGLYSVLAGEYRGKRMDRQFLGEWIQSYYRIPNAEYEKLARAFNPIYFNADEWVQIARDAGMKYLVFTSKHHDGFAMFKSEASDFNVVDATPFGRDVLKELADECHRQGIKLHIYYSQMDWYRSDYPVGRCKANGRISKVNAESYFAFMRAQLTELLTNYGPISSIWYDGWWDRPDEEWDMDYQYDLIHRLQPSCMVASNHHRPPFPGEDFQLFERDLPGANTAGFNADSKIGSLPLETCETLNGMWGYRIKDQNYKDQKTLVQYLVKTAGKNANLLMCVGPQPNGEFPALSVKAMRSMGEWLEENGESIYGTRSTVVPAQEWGVTTHKGRKMYVHVMTPVGNTVFIPYQGNKLKEAVVFHSDKKVSFQSNKDGITLQFDDVPQVDIDYIVELTFAKEILGN